MNANKVRFLYNFRAIWSYFEKEKKQAITEILLL